MNATASTKILAHVLAVTSASLLPAITLAAGDCTPSVMESPTHFPIRSQARGQSGTVFIDVTINETGRAAATALRQSSGFRLLDRAADKSVRDNWIFDISNCERKDLPVNHRIAVEYRNPEHQD